MRGNKLAENARIEIGGCDAGFLVRDVLIEQNVVLNKVSPIVAASACHAVIRNNRFSPGDGDQSEKLGP